MYQAQILKKNYNSINLTGTLFFRRNYNFENNFVDDRTSKSW